MNTAREEGKIEGKIETVISAIKEGFSTEVIMKLTGLSRAEIEKLR